MATVSLAGSTTAFFAVTLSVPLEKAVKIDWYTEDGTGKAGVDYEAASGTLEFQPGETVKGIEIIVYGRDPATGDEERTFHIRIKPPADVILGSTLTDCTIVVTDDEGTPVTTVQVATGPKGNKGNPGLSAYELAKLQGYEGTLEDWMNEVANASVAANRAETAANEVDEKIEVATADAVKKTTTQADRSEVGANRAEAAASRAETAQVLGNPYDTVAKAQADITAGKIPLNAFFSVRSASNDNYVDEYQNVAGTATATGKSFPSGALVKRLEVEANTATKTSQDVDNRTKPLEVAETINDTTGVPIINGFFDKKGRSALNVNEQGSTNISAQQFAIFPDHPLYSWAITDKRNIPYIGGSKMGGVIIGKTEIVEIPGPPGIVFTDKNWIPMACTPGYDSNQDIPVIGSPKEDPVAEFVKITLAMSMGVRVFGQSLALGVTQPARALLISTTQPYDNVTYSGGIRSMTSGTDTTIPLVESQSDRLDDNHILQNGDVMSESATSAMANDIKTRLSKLLNVTPDKLGTSFFASASGWGGMRLDQLIKGTEWYQMLLSHVQNSVRLAKAAGKTHAELVLYWVQGESDYRDGTPRSIYYGMLKQFILDYRADVKAITGQKFNPIIVAHQLSTHRAYGKEIPIIAMAIRDLALEGLLELEEPGYQAAYVDAVHKFPVWYHHAGKFAARCAVKMLSDNFAGNDFKMKRLDVISVFKQGPIAELTFNVPTPPLKWQTDPNIIAEARNKGFDIRNRLTNAVADIIQSVEIVGTDRVRIVCSRDLLADEVVVYGWGRNGDENNNGLRAGPRGNLVDSEGDLPGESYIDALGTPKRLDNCCVIFSTEGM